MTKRTVTLSAETHVLAQMAVAAGPVSWSVPTNFSSALAVQPIATKFFSIAAIAIESTFHCCNERFTTFIVVLKVINERHDMLVWLPSVIIEIIVIIMNVCEIAIQVFRCDHSLWLVFGHLLEVKTINWFFHNEFVNGEVFLTSAAKSLCMCCWPNVKRIVVTKVAITLCTWAHVLTEVTYTTRPVTWCSPANLCCTLTVYPIAAKFFSLTAVLIKSALGKLCVAGCCNSFIDLGKRVCESFTMQWHNWRRCCRCKIRKNLRICNPLAINALIGHWSCRCCACWNNTHKVKNCTWIVWRNNRHIHWLYVTGLRSERLTCILRRGSCCRDHWIVVKVILRLFLKNVLVNWVFAEITKIYVKLYA